jgi:citrate lyase subunit beta-like protein
VFADIEGLKEQSLEGARMGFTGKQCIHPGQVSTVQEAFTPSAHKIQWAREIIEAFTLHQKSGKVCV